MRKEKHLLMQNEAKAITRKTIYQVEACSCSSHLVKEMEKGVSAATIKNLNNIRSRIVKEWRSKDPKKRKSKEAIKTALEMGLRHTLRDLLEEDY